MNFQSIFLIISIISLIPGIILGKLSKGEQNGFLTAAITFCSISIVCGAVWLGSI